MDKIFTFMFDEDFRDAVVDSLKVLAQALEDGVEENEALEVLNKVAKIWLDLLLPDNDTEVEVVLK